MIGGPRVTARAYRGALLTSRNAALVAHGRTLETVVPVFLCPAIDGSSRTITSAPGPSSGDRRTLSSHRTYLTPIITRARQQADRAFNESIGSHRSYSSRTATFASSNDAAPTDTRDDGPQLLWHQNQYAARQHEESHHSKGHSPPRSSTVSKDWRRKFPKTRWRMEMDFNNYSPPLRRRQLPEDAPALYQDEIRASLAWLPESQWTLTVPDDYPLRHEFFLILDSLDDISQSASDPECGEMLVEALRQARELIWSNPQHPLTRPEDREAALYLAGKVAQTYVKLDAEDSVDRLIAFLEFIHTHIGVLPLPCFHALAAGLGIARRYDAALKICEVGQSHHGGKSDAELLHLRLRTLIVQSKGVDLTRYWDLFGEAGVKVPRKTFDLLLRTYVRRQDVDQVNQVLEAMPQHGYQVDAKAWLTILRGFQNFRATLAAMLRRDAKIVQSPTLTVVNQLLMLLSKELDVDGVLMVLRIFRIPSIDQLKDSDSTSASPADVMIINGPSPQPNAYTYAILARMFGRLGRYEETLAFFRLALSASKGPDVNVWNQKSLQHASASVMKAYLNAGHPVPAMSFATQVLKLPYFFSAEGKAPPAIDFGIPSSAEVSIPATSLHYRVLLQCFSSLLSADAARRLVVYLLEQGHPIDHEILGGLARLIFSTIDADAFESIRVIRRLLPEDKYGTSERSRRLGSLWDSLRHLGVSERISLASQHATDLGRPSRMNRSDSRDKAGKEHDTKIGKSQPTTKDELRDWLIRDSASVFAGLTPPHGDSSDASALDQELSQPLSEEAYALRIRVYAVVRRDYKSAQKVYHAMLTQGVKPTMMYIAPLVEGLTAGGKVDEAQQLKRNAKEVIGFQPTLRIHTALIRAYVRAGNMNAARREIAELIQNGYAIDETISNIIEAAQAGRQNFSLVDRQINPRNSHSVATRFHTLMRMRRYLAAQEFLQSALDSGMRVDKVLHDLVRRSVGYVEKQRDKAKAKGDSSEALELAQAARLGRENRERTAKKMNRGTELWRKRMGDHRKKVVKLVLEFADGRLEAEVKRRREQS